MANRAGGLKGRDQVKMICCLGCKHEVGFNVRSFALAMSESDIVSMKKFEVC